MNYKCSLNNNYEIIGLCDIKEYNNKINQFLDNSWEQITLSKKLILSNNKLSIKAISKVYLNIKIDKSKIIKVPSSDKQSIEGFSSTGKILLVSGEICEIIIYLSKSINSTLKSAKFTIPFSTYITLDENAILQNDLYCIYPYIENISLRILNKRTLINNITLFLFAHNTTRIPLSPVIEKFLTFLTFKASNSDEEIATIEFDKNNMILMVTSTGINYGSISSMNAFVVKILSSDGTIKNFGVIKSDENADNFKNDLDIKRSQFGDFIEVNYLNPSKVTLNNFPNSNDLYNMDTSKKSEKFLITPDRLIPILTPNKITIKSKKNEEVLSIEFAKERKIFIVSSTGTVPDPNSSDVYLILILNDINGKEIFKRTLNSNENGNSFKALLNGKPFEYNKNTLILIYKDISKVEISNFPIQGIVYKPTEDINVFIIQPNNLRNITFNNKIKILNENDKEMSSLYFIPSISTSIIKILSTSNDIISTTSGNPNEKYIQFLQYSKNNPIFYGEILKKQNAINFANKLDRNVIDLNFRNFLRLSNRLKNKILITNYKNQNEYKIGEEAEFLSISQNSLVPTPLSYNKLRLKNKDNSNILYIYFHKVSNNIIYIEPYSTGVINKDLTSFSFTIKNPVDKSIVISYTINQGESGDLININPPYNISQNLKIGFLFIIEYSDNSLIEIFNFPFITPPYNPSLNTTSETFIITENGLKKFISPTPPYVTKLPNAIILNDINDLPILTVEFNTLNKELVINSTKRLTNPIGTEDYFLMSLLESDGITEKQISWVGGNQTSGAFKNSFNNLNFEFGDILNLQYEERSNLIITNYSNEGKAPYTPLGNQVNFKITPQGLLEVLPSRPIIKLQNAFIFKTFSKDYEMARVEFDIKNLRLLVTSTGISYTINNEKAPIFKFELVTLGGDIQTYAYIYGNKTAYNFKHILDNYNFNYNQIINLTFQNVSKVFLTNYPNLSDTYFMLSRNKQSFKITQTGIIPNVLQNTIILNDINNIPILTVEFDALNKQFLINSTTKIANETGTINYFIMSLFESDGINLKKTSSIIGSNNGTFFKETFNSIDFQYGDILKLDYEENSKISITNYPNKGDTPYTLLGNQQKFKITRGGLKLI